MTKRWQKLWLRFLRMEVLRLYSLHDKLEGKELTDIHLVIFFVPHSSGTQLACKYIFKKEYFLILQECIVRTEMFGDTLPKVMGSKALDEKLRWAKASSKISEGLAKSIM